MTMDERWVREQRRPSALRPRRPDEDLAVIIPTYRGGGVTGRTLRRLAQGQPDLVFRILVIDNGGHDAAVLEAAAAAIEASAAAWVDVISTVANVGAGGALMLGQEAALAAGFSVMALADHDADLLTPGGLRLLAGRLGVWDMVAPCHPAYTGVPARESPPRGGIPFHYMMLHRRVADRIGWVDPRYVLYVDDLDYTARAMAAGFKVGLIPGVRYAHPPQKPRVFENPAAYRTVRNHLLLARKPGREVGWGTKARACAFLAAYLGMKAVHTLQTGDASIPVAVARGILDACTGRFRWEMPPNSFAYLPVEPSPEESRAAVDMSDPRNRWRLRKSYFIQDADGRPAYFRFTPRPRPLLQSVGR